MAVSIAIPSRRAIYVPISLIFVYTTVVNIIERPEGLQIATWFIVTIVAIPNAIAGLLLDLRDRTQTIPHAYFGWTEGNPMAYLLKFPAFGEGDTAPVCREVLRQAEPDPARRPRVHVG